MLKKEQIEIPLNKKNLIVMLIGSIAFVCIGIWFVLQPELISNQLFSNKTFTIIIGVVSILFFGLCAIYIIRKLPDDKPGLTIDNIGLIDNSSGFSVGKIQWSDIENISVITIHRQKLILLYVKNPQEYIKRESSGFRRKLLQSNYSIYGTPLSITSNALKIKFEDLLNVLNERYRTHNQN